jgi:hypothetical protein
MDPMNEESDVYHAYLLRLWSVLVQGKRQWRASLESPHSGERHVFASPEQCFVYLREQFVSKEYNHEGPMNDLDPQRMKIQGSLQDRTQREKRAFENTQRK